MFILQTTTELRRITFQILENDQTKDFPDSAQEITFEEVEAFQSSPDSFSAVTETEEAPTDIRGGPHGYPAHNQQRPRFPGDCERRGRAREEQEKITI